MNTILVLDDDQLSVEFIKLFLEGEGYAVLSAFSCSQARSLFEEHRPGIVVLDLELEDGSGLEFAQFVKDRGNARIILASGYDKAHLERNGENLQILDAILTKPIELSDLKNALTLS